MGRWRTSTAQFDGGRVAVALLIAALLAPACESDSDTREPNAGPAACTSAADCEPDEWCAVVECTDNHGCVTHCGAGAPVTGECQLRPTECATVPPDTLPICACDGQLYESECAAQMAGVRPDINRSHCPDPPGLFGCGGSYCDVGSAMCAIETMGLLGSQTFCRPIPAACGSPPDCDCLKNDLMTTYPELSCQSCEASGEGIQVNCTSPG